MAATARAILFDLPQGFEFPAMTFQLSRGDVGRYLDAVNDHNTVYSERGFVPPLAIAARALGALLEASALPAGTLHTGQEIESHQGCRVGTPLTFSGRIAQRSERAGLVIAIIEFAVAMPDGAPVVSGRTTVMAPANVARGEPA